MIDILTVGAVCFAGGALLVGRLDSFSIGAFSLKVRDGGVYFSEDCTHGFIRFKRKVKKQLHSGLITDMIDKYQEPYHSHLLSLGCDPLDKVVQLEIGAYKNALELSMRVITAPSVLEILFENGFQAPNSIEFKEDIRGRVSGVFKEARNFITPRWCSTIIDRGQYIETQLKDPILIGYIQERVIDFFVEAIAQRNNIYKDILKRYKEKTEEDISLEWKLLFE
jgi:hypothetical protein